MPRLASTTLTEETVQLWLDVEDLVWKQAWKWAKLTGYDANDFFSEAKLRWFTKWHKTFDTEKALLTTYIYHATNRTFARIANKQHRLCYNEPTDFISLVAVSTEELHLGELPETATSIVNTLLTHQRDLFQMEIDGRSLRKHAVAYLREIGYTGQEIAHATRAIKQALS